MQYKEMGRTKVSDNRSVVISEAIGAENKFTISQLITSNEGSKPINIFLKGGIQIKSEKELALLRDTITSICDDLGV